MLHIGILAFTNCYCSSIYGPYDLFSVANIEARNLRLVNDEDLFKVSILTIDGSTVMSSSKIPIQPHTSICDSSDLDIVFLPAMLGDYEPVLESKDLKKWLQYQQEKGTHLCSVCAGAFFLAEAGLLEGRHATTHWALAEDFQNRYKKVRLKPKRMLIDEGDIITAGGISAYLDMSLYLISKFGSRELSAACSKTLLIDAPRSIQSPYQMAFFRSNHNDNEILQIQEWLAENFHINLKISQLAQQAGMGERTFLRRFKQATGDLPSEYIQRLRIESARHLLETSVLTIEEITYKIGYEDSNSFRRLFKLQTGLTPGSYRKRFSLY